MADVDFAVAFVEIGARVSVSAKAALASADVRAGSIRASRVVVAIVRSSDAFVYIEALSAVTFVSCLTRAAVGSAVVGAVSDFVASVASIAALVIVSAAESVAGVAS